MMPVRTPHLREALWCSLLGAGIFLALFGHRVLDPGNIAWLCHGDPMQHFLGWHFFRTQAWSFPLGLNPEFGLELSNSIVYTDSTPLLALPLKLVAPFLPAIFQYSGMWLMACIVLQAWFGLRLTALATAHTGLRLLGAGIFAVAPPMLIRLGGHPGISGHFSLVGHFVILAALYLVLRPVVQRRMLPWSSLLLATALIHAYLFAMVVPLWLAGLADAIHARTLPGRSAMREVALTTLLVSVAVWQAGYFTVGAGTSSEGFGYFRMNLLSLFDSSGWSWILPDIPERGGCYEGFNYLGLGVLLLGVTTLPGLIRNRGRMVRAIVAKPFFSATMVSLFLFALSHNIGIGLGGVRLDLPEWILRPANIFRSSGRMFWPVYYLLVWAIVSEVIRERGRALALMLLAGTLLVQIADTSAGWLTVREKMMSLPRNTFASPLQDPFWGQAARRYAKVRRAMPENQPPSWAVLAWFSREYGLSTDSVYLARMNMQALEMLKQRSKNMLESGSFDTDTLYILDDESFRTAKTTIDQDQDLLANIDGFHVLAPGWKRGDSPLLTVVTEEPLCGKP